MIWDSWVHSLLLCLCTDSVAPWTLILDRVGAKTTMLGAGGFMHGLGGVIKHISRDLTQNGQAYSTAFLICFMALFVSAGLYLTTRDSKRWI
jgi:hypothetical protein